MQVPPWVINSAYVIASILFIRGLKGLTHPRTAVRGNLLGACGMLLAIVITLLHKDIQWFAVIVAGLIVGSAIGAVLAVRIQMTAMPQLVALFNGFGGAASVLVAGANFHAVSGKAGATISTQLTIATAASGLIGAVTFWGSLVAFGKLQELISGKSILLPGRQVINAALAVIAILLALCVVVNPQALWVYWILALVSSVLGVLLVLPIGGADMPVVIALLNSYSGLAAAATGFV